MAASVGCQPDTFLYASPTSATVIAEAGQRLGLQTVLAVMQILDQTLSRMRYSTQGRILAELALVRICHLEDLEEISQVIAQIRGGLPINVISAPANSNSPALPTPAIYTTTTSSSEPEVNLGEDRVKKNDESVATPPISPSAPVSSTAVPKVVLTPENAMELWSRAINQVSGMVADQARRFHTVAISAPNTLAISFKTEYAGPKLMCERHSARFEQAMASVTGQLVRIQFRVEESAGAAVSAAAAPTRAISQHQLMMEIAKHPMVQQAAELFGATPAKVESPNVE
jgi:DNA polymerase-3 subunit gamma/tau